ncbi:hypothetical protein OV142_08525 [Nannocystis sp. SCPEA4]|nr:hypothetical protein [Nannocystis sp. SCPEA4]
MQRVFVGPSPAKVTNATKLNCTAGDIRLSEAIKVEPESCIENEDFTLTATFRTNVTADSRYDAGFFFRTDGGLSARGDGVDATGTCSLSALDPDDDPGEELDGDACGDLNAGTYENVTFTIPNVKCVAAPGTNRVRLPNCTSWHSNQGNFCSPIDDAFDFDPDTKSKCKCDDNFTVPVVVQRATLDVDKSPSVDSVQEPGGDVTFTVVVTNTAAAASASVVLETLEDDVYGDLFDAGNENTSDECLALFLEVIAPGDSVTCDFTAPVEGEFGDAPKKDTVEACVSQQGVNTLICAQDDAEVKITDASVPPTLTKTAMGTKDCGVSAIYKVAVTNKSTIDKLTVNSLNDDTFGDVTKIQGNVLETGCASLLTTLDPGQTKDCTFVGRLTSSSCELNHVNEVTASITDEDGVPFSPDGQATVTLTTTP